MLRAKGLRFRVLRAQGYLISDPPNTVIAGTVDS